MASESLAAAPTKRPPVFALACWALGLMALFQLLIAGMALAARFENTRREKVVVREVPKLVVVRIPAASEEAPAPPAGIVSTPPAEAAPVTAADIPLPEPTPLAVPAVADPRSERLLKEAKKARVNGDMAVAILKLETALAESPDDPSLHYEMGLVHELMGVFDTASAHYAKVVEMGTDAGALYPLAAAKLRDGFQEETPMGKLALSRVRIYKDPDTSEGERVVLTIPVQKAPGEEIETKDLSVNVYFFNRTSKGDIIQLAPEHEDWVTDKWKNPQFTWANGEEILQMTYVIPPLDPSTAHLFGQESYYGQVVTLVYKGTVVDVQPWPRELAARMPKMGAGPEDSPSPLFQDSLPADFDPSLPLLPPLPPK